MPRLACVVLVLVAVTLAGCSASPNNPVNQTTPIRDMDSFFRSLSGPPAPLPERAPGYEREPGYAPAYPPYQP